MGLRSVRGDNSLGGYVAGVCGAVDDHAPSQSIDRSGRPQAHAPVIEPRHLLCRHINAGDFRAQFDTQRRLANIFGWCGVVRFWDACFKMDAPNKNPANRAGAKSRGRIVPAVNEAGG
jgi:hypothetical protein